MFLLIFYKFKNTHWALGNFHLRYGASFWG